MLMVHIETKIIDGRTLFTLHTPVYSGIPIAYSLEDCIRMGLIKSLAHTPLEVILQIQNQGQAQ